MVRNISYLVLQSQLIVARLPKFVCYIFRKYKYNCSFRRQANTLNRTSKMHIRNYILAVFSATAALISCNNSESPETLTNVDNQTHIKADSIELTTLGANQTHINADSVELTALVRNVYEWHEIKYHNHSFPLKFNQSDTVFIGIDWEGYDKDYETFKRTHFFTEEFLARHRAIATTLDSLIKQSSIEWRNTNDGIPIWDTNSDDWCNCQDSPDNYWKRLTFGTSNSTAERRLLIGFGIIMMELTRHSNMK